MVLMWGVFFLGRSRLRFNGYKVFVALRKFPLAGCNYCMFIIDVNDISCYRTVPSATWRIFSEFLIFCNLIAKYEKEGKCLPILHEGTCDNYFIVKYLLKSNVSRVILFPNCLI